MSNIYEELNQAITSRVIQHRNSFFQILQQRYYNILPTLITYKVGKGKTLNVNIDFFKLEYVLRYYGNAVVGLDKYNDIVLLGYTTNVRNDILFNNYGEISIKFINDVIPVEKYTLISKINNYTKGNCIIINNNLFTNNLNDYGLIDFYCQELAEIKTSRFSLILQSKMQTIFRGDIGDETINQLVTDLYNGAPFIKTSKNFDIDEQIIKLDNSSTELLTSLKNEYNNVLSEFNNLLGINTSYKEKESGISNVELNGNINFINSNANMYILARNSAFKKLYKRFGIKIIAKFREKEVKKNENNN